MQFFGTIIFLLGSAVAIAAPEHTKTLGAVIQAAQAPKLESIINKKEAEKVWKSNPSARAIFYKVQYLDAFEQKNAIDVLLRYPNWATDELVLSFLDRALKGQNVIEFFYYHLSHHTQSLASREMFWSVTDFLHAYQELCDAKVLSLVWNHFIFRTLKYDHYIGALFYELESALRAHSYMPYHYTAALYNPQSRGFEKRLYSRYESLSNDQSRCTNRIDRMAKCLRSSFDRSSCAATN